jgi:hypothetical protein
MNIYSSGRRMLKKPIGFASSFVKESDVIAKYPIAHQGFNAGHDQPQHVVHRTGERPSLMVYRQSSITIRPLAKVLVSASFKACAGQKGLDKPVPLHLNRMQNFVVRILLQQKFDLPIRCRINFKPRICFARKLKAHREPQQTDTIVRRSQTI